MYSTENVRAGYLLFCILSLTFDHLIGIRNDWKFFSHHYYIYILGRVDTIQYIIYFEKIYQIKFILLSVRQVRLEISIVLFKIIIYRLGTHKILIKKKKKNEKPRVFYQENNYTVTVFTRVRSEILS